LNKEIDELRYKIKRFSKSDDLGYLRCIDIYLRNTVPALRTETNQISYWLDRLSNSEECDKREIFIFGFYLNNTEIGYAQIMHLKDKKIVIIDYMAIEEKYRKMGAFFQFTDLLHKYIDTYMVGYNYILTEVGYLSNSKKPTNKSQALIRLLKTRGMGIIKALYYQAQLSPYNKESSMQAQLLIYSTTMPSEIKRETYLFIVESILFDHYMYWYEPFLEFNEKILFEKDLKKIFEDIKKNTSSLVEINSYGNDFIGDDTNQLPEKEISPLMNIGILLIFITFVVLSFIAVHSLLSINIYVLLVIYLFSTTLILLLMSMYFPKANKPLKMVVELLKHFFHKR
jgi:hypothetical protein